MLRGDGFGIEGSRDLGTPLPQDCNNCNSRLDLKHLIRLPPFSLCYKVTQLLEYRPIERAILARSSQENRNGIRWPLRFPTVLIKLPR